MSEPLKCIACGNELPQDSTTCPLCLSPQKLKICQICGKAMPRNAERCNGCTSYQRWRRHIQFWAAFALAIGGFFTLISTGWSGVVYVLDRNSDTKFKVTSSDDLRIYLRVWNTGRRPSTLVGYRLIFDDSPRKELELDLSDKDQPEATNVIAPGGAVAKVSLARALLSTIPAASRRKQYTEPELQELLHDPKSPWVDRLLTLEVDVEESSDPWCPWNLFRSHHTRTDRFPAGRIQKFVVRSLGG